MLHENVRTFEIVTTKHSLSVFFTLVLRQAKFPTEDQRVFMATNQISSHEAHLNIN